MLLESMKFFLMKYGIGNVFGFVVGGVLEVLEVFFGKFNLKFVKKKGFIKVVFKMG